MTEKLLTGTLSLNTTNQPNLYALYILTSPGEVRQIKESFPTNLHTLGPALKSSCRGDSGNKLVLPVLPFRQKGAELFLQAPVDGGFKYL